MESQKATGRGSGDPGEATAPADAGALSREALEGVRRRERQALSTFFDRFAPQIHQFAYRMLGEKAAADDATQEVFLRVWRGAATLDPDRRPDPWILRITLNVCRDVWRSRHHRLAARSQPIEDIGRDALPSPTPDPETAASTAERRHAVQRAILALPEGLREIVVMREYEDLSHLEIAEVLGVSHAAVRKRYSRALAKLGQSLARMLS